MITQSYYFYNFKLFFFFLLLGLILSIILVGVNFIFMQFKTDKEKLSPYECGFEPFESARIKFNIHYYIIAILFIIFDVEIIFLFPWVLTFSFFSILSYWVVYFFLLLLTFGFIIEWVKFALKW